MGAGQLWSGVTEMGMSLAPFTGARVCLREIIGDEVVMAAQDDGMTLRRLGNAIQEALLFLPRLERFLSIKRGGVMSHPLNLQRGFSLPEVLAAMVLMVMTSPRCQAISGIMHSFALRHQYLQIWRQAWQQTALYPFFAR